MPGVNQGEVMNDPTSGRARDMARLRLAGVGAPLCERDPLALLVRDVCRAARLRPMASPFEARSLLRWAAWWLVEGLR